MKRRDRKGRLAGVGNRYDGGGGTGEGVRELRAPSQRKRATGSLYLRVACTLGVTQMQAANLNNEQR